MKTLRPIIVFDSGIGGLSIYRPLKVALPQANVVYLMDSLNFPYGNKSQSWLSERFSELALEFSALNPALVVLACNTATTHIIANLRQSLKCPVIGVEPVIKPLSKYPRALVLMTNSASKSITTLNLLKQFGQHVQIYAPTNLASAIEYNNIEQMKKCIHEIKDIVLKQNIQAIGLSCTHYPLILNELKKAMPEVDFIDPSEAVVREVVRVLESTGYGQS